MSASTIESVFAKYLTLAFQGFVAAEVSLAAHPTETKAQAILAAVGTVAQVEEGATNPLIATIAALTANTLAVLYATGQVTNPNPPAPPAGTPPASTGSAAPTPVVGS